MKTIYKISMLACGVLWLLASCSKVESLPFYQESTATQLTASAASLNVTAENADQDIVTFSWTDAKLATDSANQKYMVEIAPKGSNFANPISYTVYGVTQVAVKGADINNALVSWGAAYGTSMELEARTVSSYRNNNDLKVSNLVEITASAYAVPFTLNASATGTFEPVVATKDDEFTELSWIAPQYGTASLTYQIEYALNGTNFADAKAIEVEAEALSKGLTGMELYQMANASGVPLNSTGKVDVRIKAMITGTGQTSYSNTVILTIKPVEMTLYMYVPGDYQGWDPATASRIASTDGINYEGYVWVPAGGSGEFKISAGPNWDLAYGGDATTLSTSGGNLKFPETGAMFLIKVNMQTMAYSLTKTDWGLIGAATPGGWDNSTPMIFDAASGRWKATALFTAGEFKFRANNAWDLNLGGSPTYLSYGGANIVATAGLKTVYLDLREPGKYTYTIE